MKIRKDALLSGEIFRTSQISPFCGDADSFLVSGRTTKLPAKSPAAPNHKATGNWGPARRRPARACADQRCQEGGDVNEPRSSTIPPKTERTERVLEPSAFPTHQRQAILK